MTINVKTNIKRERWSQIETLNLIGNVPLDEAN